MAAVLLDGKRCAEQMKAELRAEVARLRDRGIVPTLVAVLVGDNPASQMYVSSKAKASEELGLGSRVLRLGSDTSEEKLLRTLKELNEDRGVHGILVQLPLPAQIREATALQSVAPHKDVDCFHPINMGRLLAGDPLFVPATPGGIQQLLVRSGFPPDGKHVTILGRSNIVGKPLATLLMQKRAGANATVTVAHSGTANLPAVTRAADIVVAAIGRPRFVTSDFVRDGAVVVDVGVNRVPDPSAPKGYRVVGDVDFEAVRAKAAAISPVPGGVGPMTIAMLLANTVKAASLAA